VNATHTRDRIETRDHDRDRDRDRDILSAKLAATLSVPQATKPG
jgi:hypothetical protein